MIKSSMVSTNLLPHICLPCSIFTFTKLAH